LEVRKRKHYEERKTEEGCSDSDSAAPEPEPASDTKEEVEYIASRIVIIENEIEIFFRSSGFRYRFVFRQRLRTVLS
jgi:hypothetical protein